MSGYARNAFLFQCGDEQLFAVSLNKTGANIPRGPCTQGWVLREEFLLGVQEPVPAAISPEPHARSWTLVIEPDGKERATTWSERLPLEDESNV